MKFKRRIGYQQPVVSVAWVPLLNMVCLLFFAYVLQYGFLAQPAGAQVHVPALIAGDTVPYEHITLVLSGNGEVYHAGSRIAAQDLPAFLSLISQRHPAVFIQAHRTTSLDVVMRVWDACRTAGISGVSMVTEP